MNSENNFFKSKNLLFLGLFAIFFIFIGVLIATNLDLSSRTSAQSPQILPVAKSVTLNYIESPFVAVAEKVNPAVVNISANRVVEGRDYHYGVWPWDDEFFRRFFGEPPREQKPRKYQSQSTGSGFIFRRDGYILTNNHVVAWANQAADKIIVKLSDETEYKAKLIGRDPGTDIAILKIDAGHDLPYAELGNSDSIRVGDWAIAIGNPFPQLGLDRTLTVGVISAKGRRGFNFGRGETPDYQNYIQTDASINPGNSGGPLVNIRGEVIGINAAITSPSGGNVGIGFAIPINFAKNILPELIAEGKVVRGYLGISPKDITKDLAEAMELESTSGVIVERVQAGTPAEEAGLKVGDVIIKYNDVRVEDAQQFRDAVAATSPSQKIKLDVLRKGKILTIQAKLKERPPLTTAEEEPQPQEKNWLGLRVETASKYLAQQYETKFAEGVIVTEVEVGSPADEKGIQEGDIILEIDGKKVPDEETYNKVINMASKKNKAISFLISREGSTYIIAIKPEK